MRPADLWWLLLLEQEMERQSNEAPRAPRSTEEALIQVMATAALQLEAVARANGKVA